MLTSPELITQIQRERERQAEQDRRAGVIQCMRYGCDSTFVDRLVRALGRAPSGS